MLGSYAAVIGLLLLPCALLYVYFDFKGYMESLVTTTFDNNPMVVKSSLEVPSKYWGTYRPGVYFGMKTREPYSPVFGIMWYLPRILRATGGGIRHWCENGDNLNRFIWTEHDGVNFGIQEIEDGPFKLTTSFVKRLGGSHGGDWTARITVTNPDQTLSTEPIALLFYTAIEKHTKGSISPKKKQGLYGVVGETDKLGPFSIRLLNVSGSVDHQSYLSVEAKGLNQLKETLLSFFTVINVPGEGKQIVLPGDMSKGNSPNFIVTQILVKTPFVIDVVYESDNVDRTNMLTGDVYMNELKRHSDNFHDRFEKIFELKAKGYDSDKISFAKAAFSNLVGGIGYFYGSSRVKSEYTKDPVPYWKAPLYTAVPSRSFFPRGFLWDEGFHGLLIAMWDLDIELDIICHWFDLMNVEGWIPREQILGAEALAKVPEQFVTQINTNANPPTFFLTLKFILDNFKEHILEDKRLATLDRLYPRLTAWFNWFNTTQFGDLPGTYRWRGRDGKTVHELNPKTLTSGLDDYPRASHPNIDERHVDLRCWIALSAATIAELAKILNRSSRKYEETYDYLSDQNLLDSLHWSPKTEAYSDFGLHTDAVVLSRPPPPPPPAPPVQQDVIRVVLKDPVLQFVDSTFGYVSMFPFFFHLIDSNSPKLEKILNDIKNPDLCWTSYGLRSLAKKSPLYLKYNTEHDGPYWRGPIWINMNFMAVRSLLHYSKIPGPYSSLSAEIYEKLKNILINNIYREYKRTGYIWEQYNDKTGEGQGTKSFTGWSSLVVLLMADML
ncbi:mannosyl-oligosaccharide glucosidase isoform X2 [Lycorma delicatula]|uniref:mannosyl-oligosaccharide glucosidase isoform X2 n=1 Tax=Lycorma delicatula TaxID=130591 RepID=UPI003F51968B